MIMEGKFTLEGSIQKVWENLLDVKTLASCVPGCEKMELIDEKTYDVIVKQRVGPISVRFKFRSVLSEVTPPTHLKVTGTGADIGKAGTFSQETTVDLKEGMEGGVEVFYRSNVTIVGRLATFGDRIFRAKAKEVGEQFTQALQKRLQSVRT